MDTKTKIITSFVVIGILLLIASIIFFVVYFSKNKHKLLPINSPLYPIISPLDPIITPLDPINSPLYPIDKPFKPIEKPLLPINSPLYPIEKPSLPIIDPSLPINSPLYPIIDPSLPINSPLYPIISPLTPIEKPLTPIVSPLYPIKPSFNWPNNTIGILLNLSDKKSLGFTYQSILAMTGNNQVFSLLKVIKSNTTIKISLDNTIFYIAKDLSVSPNQSSAANWYYLESTGQIVDDLVSPTQQWGLQMKNGINFLVLKNYLSQPQLDNIWLFKNQ